MDPTEFETYAKSVYHHPERSADVVRHLREELVQLRRSTDHVRLAFVAMCLATRDLFYGDGEDARPLVDEGLAAISPDDDIETYLNLLNLLAIDTKRRNDGKMACAVFLRMRRIGLERGDLKHADLATVNLAYVLVEFGEPQLALSVVDVHEQLRPKGLRTDEPFLLVRYTALIAARRYGEAAPLRPAIEQEMHRNDWGEAGRLLVRLADIELAVATQPTHPKLQSLYQDLLELGATPWAKAMGNRIRITLARAAIDLLLHRPAAAAEEVRQILVGLNASIRDAHATRLEDQLARALEQLGDIPGALAAQRRSTQRAERALLNQCAYVGLGDILNQVPKNDFANSMALEETNRALRRAFRDLQQTRLELANARDSAEQARHAAERAAETRQQFLSNMSHELRTPLVGVLGATELLGETNLSPHQHSLVRVLERSARLALGVIGDVLDVGKLESGAFRVQDDPVRLQDVHEDVFSVLAGRARKGHVRLSRSVDPTVPAWVQGDRQRLTQVLMNLVSNAIRFSEGGTVHVDVRNDGELVWEVRDTGCGMTPEDLAVVFDAYRQSSRAHSSSGEGTGLGLAICSGLVQAMGGSIHAASTPGDGTTMTVRLPLRPGEPPTTEVPVVADTDLRGIRVLVAEDNPINQMILRMHLESAGALVHLVPDGPDVLSALRDHPYDVVLLDLHMPSLGGVATARKLRTQGCELPLIALTASMTPEDRTTALAAGMNGHLCKPVPRDQLCATILRSVRSNANVDFQSQA